MIDAKEVGGSLVFLDFAWREMRQFYVLLPESFLDNMGIVSSQVNWIGPESQIERKFGLKSAVIFYDKIFIPQKKFYLFFLVNNISFYVTKLSR